VDVTEPGTTFQLLDGRLAAAQAAELLALHADVYAGGDFSGGTGISGDTGISGGTGADGGQRLVADRFRVQCRQPGFVLAQARHGSYLVGYAAGMPLRPSTSWWRHLTTPLPDEVITEHPGRTFALTELAVRTAWRRQGIGQTLHDLILQGRPEERGTLIIAPTAVAAQAALQNWGWRKVARTRDPDRGMAVFDVLVIKLSAHS
jgi:ribosomal protein S18 acetylase RimI-like enzyme